MFGDVFGTKADYSKGILYSSRHKYLVEKPLAQSPTSSSSNRGSSSSISTTSVISDGNRGKLWEDANQVRAPSCLRSKQQMRRELLRRNDVTAKSLPPLRHLKFLEKIQEHADHDTTIRNMLLMRSQQNLAAMEKKKAAASSLLLPEAKKVPLLSSLIPADMTAVPRRPSIKPNRKLSSSDYKRGSGSYPSDNGLQPSPADLEAAAKARQEEQERLAWVYVTGKGHPYW